MRGATAKSLRRAAKLMSQGLPEREYFDTVEVTRVTNHPITGDLIQIDSITTRLSGECQRDKYKKIKKAFKRAYYGR